MIDRILTNWKTTAIGVLILIVAAGAVYLDKATLTEAGAFMGVGIALFFSKDGKPKK
jgi:hypothetical protein